jgi:hypothetical protein
LPVTPGTTYRQRLERATADPACLACHRLVDPPGFSLESLDALGRFRTVDNGQPVDASGTIMLDGRTVRFTGAVELGRALATSCDVRLCTARRWLEHALGRSLGDTDEASVREVAAAFAASGFDLRELLVAIVQTQAFLAP